MFKKQRQLQNLVNKIKNHTVVICFKIYKLATDEKIHKKCLRDQSYVKVELQENCV